MSNCSRCTDGTALLVQSKSATLSIPVWGLVRGGEGCGHGHGGVEVGLLWQCETDRQT